jgi:F1F0 ATPase subunit 2
MSLRITMSETLTLSAALLAGILLGSVFYGGLWWTVRRVVSKTSSAWLIGSFALRAAIALSGFYGVSQGDWRSLLACLSGFLIARVGATRVLPARLGTHP